MTDHLLTSDAAGYRRFDTFDPWRVPAGRRALRRAVGAWAGLAVALLVALLGGGCAYRLGSLFGSDTDQPLEAATTGAKVADADALTTSSVPVGSDLALARLAIADALGRGGSSRSVPWENPATGARGTVTALSAGEAKDDGRVCRDFLASHVRAGQETWLSGEACRKAKADRWEVERLVPWKRG